MPCPLIDYLAWAPLALATVTAAAIAATGAASRRWPVLQRVPDVFATILVVASLLAVVAILVAQRSCG